MRPHGALALAKHAPRSGARVVEIGCGGGDTTLDLARLVGPKGSVVGLDTSDALVERARREAQAAGARNVTFVRGEAERFRVDESERFDLFFTRFGATSLGALESTLRNMRRALKPGGRLLNVAWRAAALNPWARACPSGLFSLADPDVTRALLERSGYVDVTLEAIDAPIVVGTNLEEAVARLLDVGPVAQQGRDALVADLHAALEPFVTPRGVVMGSSSWCITARNPS